MNVLAIDPGDVESAYVLIGGDYRPIRFGILPNIDLLVALRTDDLAADQAAVEMIASYGMPVGAEVFNTCVWIGRFYETILGHGPAPALVKRHAVKMHHCHNGAARDSHVRQALVDRFEYGARNHGKGTKAVPTRFYGFVDDVWQAYALAVYLADEVAG